MITLTIGGIPMAKGRARTVRLKNGKVKTFTPEDTAIWEQEVRLAALPHRPRVPLDGPLEAEMTFYLYRPGGKKREYPCVRPDLDNYAKSVLDALNGIIYTDDSRIVKLTLSKLYGDPRVEVKIWEVEARGKTDEAKGARCSYK